MLASGELGQHNGLPASIIVTTSLEDLEAAAGSGLTGGGTRLPMSDVIRLLDTPITTGHFDKGNAVALITPNAWLHPDSELSCTRRIAVARRPDALPRYYCEVHHITDYAQSHTTDVDDLTFACGPHHRMLRPSSWTTQNTPAGVQWIPPPPRPGPTTHQHLPSPRATVMR